MRLLKISLLFLFLTIPFALKGESPPEVAEFLSEYIQYPSLTGEEKEAAHFLAEFAREKGFEVKFLHDDPGSHNLAISLYPLEDEKPNIIFLNHIDVVKASDEDLWRYPAFSGAIAEGKVWGRGAIDNKGMAAMQLFAMLEHLDKAHAGNLPFNVTMIAVSNEERGGSLGAQRVVDDYLEQLNPVTLLGEGGVGLKGLIGGDPEQVAYGISIAQKRGVWIRLKVETESGGHGSVPPDKYANRQLVEALDRISKRDKEVRFTPPVELMFYEIGLIEGGIRGLFLRNISTFSPILSRVLKRDELLRSIVTNTITITDISNPVTSDNQIPQWATATLDCRLLPGTPTESFVSYLEDKLAGTGAEIEVIKETSISKYSRLDDYYDIFRESILAVEPESAVIPILFPANNDNNYFRARGVPAFGLLPTELTMSQMESIHNVNERIPVDGLERGVRIYSTFLEKLLENPPEELAGK